ncbi:Transposase for transposon Tn5 [Photorhabdus australis subsp. thailandensis]|uniref:Transposase for transposon Tn5 n=1 Tax=Photorhabdus australis subsp. thailandensis TaxID=2805096 RepID=A0A1C0U890_9GAMM|nr:Transposase for transposon Tn5 [Photorhabdus australis subsp. thailandensis]
MCSAEDAHRIFTYYEHRWLIEEFHKAWKTGGTQVEDLRMQSKGNLERMIVLLGFIAVRIHQLRYLGLNKEKAEKQSCEVILSPQAWKLLWLKQEKSRPPKEPPNLYWAYINLGKLADWVKQQLERKHSNLVACALANKLARIAWAITTQHTVFVA